jgi:hypothetical protein
LRREGPKTAAILNSSITGFQADSDLPEARCRDTSEFDPPIRRARSGVGFAVAWFGCLVVGSLLPKWKVLFHIPHRLHLLVHFVVFALSAFLAFGFAPSRGRRFFCLIGLIGLAFALEALQRAIYPIHFEWRDFVADSLGVLAALLLVAISDSRRDISFD